MGDNSKFEDLARPTRGAATRARILEVASGLFLTHGIHEVSADRIIEQVGITKVTFYRHFRTKEDLVIAYLQDRAKIEFEAFEEVWRQAAGDVGIVLEQVAAGIGAESCRPGFRGCPFINAAAEYADESSPIRRVVSDHRAWMASYFRRVLSAAGVDRLDEATDAAVMLRDGAMVSGYLTDPLAVARTLHTMLGALVVEYRPVLAG